MLRLSRTRLVMLWTHAEKCTTRRALVRPHTSTTPNERTQHGVTRRVGAVDPQKITLTMITYRAKFGCSKTNGMSVHGTWDSKFAPPRG